MYSLPSMSQIRQPFPRSMKRGVPPTEPKARTGLFTPPGILRLAARKAAEDFACVWARIRGFRLFISSTKFVWTSGVELQTLGRRFTFFLVAFRRGITLSQPSHGHQALVGRKVHDPHALGRSTHG